MRPIDADKALAEAKRISGPITGDGWDNYGVYALIERQPTVEAVPLDKLCDWLAAVADGDPSICMECAGNKGDGEWECPDEGEACKDSEVWKRHIRAWMQKEGLNATD